MTGIAGVCCSVYAAGFFTQAGGSPADYIARWQPEAVLFCDGFESGATSGWSQTAP